MEKDQGDLADIVRASGGVVTTGSAGTPGGSSTSYSNKDKVDWHISTELGNFPSTIKEPIDNFGDPFSNMHDPLLLHELDIPIPSPSFFDRSNSSGLVKMDIEENISTSSHHLSRTIFDESMRRPANNIFSRMLQISPNSNMSSSSSTTITSPCDMMSTVMTSPRVATSKTSCSSSIETALKSNNSPNTGCSIESVGMMQISSPRNPGIKRRKSQAKKVVCIPAPAAANSSRPSSGEVVPSDLWAWRKYGQKPIKGSPYPRGYYRCSSSKGCSARKQVERSRTDPNMLVITYTSEHNHPWPTQRNALAGSTRSQPPKNNAASKSTTSPQTSMKLMNVKQELQENAKESMSISVVDGSINVSPSSIKEEILEKPIDDMGDQADHLDTFHQIYRPASELLDSNLQPDDFFADLGELEYDPLNLLFTEEFNGKSDEGRQNKALDPFSLFDWAGNNSMFGENKRGGL
ncbi:Wrky transcription factor [Thalictrum thalictroides]|uniref:Wrky transcription factor n=1 Tax=Thalictrum thalictroides TaxID=46969 RepID=A0A7J6XD02_THATH|nr:Wrky transcription factor [Thalictrum thalictroides]